MPLNWVITHLDPRENPPEFQVGDLVEVTDRWVYSMITKRARITLINRGGRYGECYSRCCNQYTVSVIRQGGPSTLGMDYVDTLAFNGSEIVHAEVREGDLVRCDMAPNGGYHAGSHFPRSTCTNPRVDSAGFVAEYEEVRQRLADARLQREQEITNMRNQITLGTWYYLTSGGQQDVRDGQVRSIFCPHRWLSGNTSEMSGVIMNLDTGYTESSYAHFTHLGAAVSNWRLNTLPPPGLSQGQPRFAVTVRNGDIMVAHDDDRLLTLPDPDDQEPARRGVATRTCSCCPPVITRDDRDNHSCDDECDDYGCPFEDSEDRGDDGTIGDLVHHYSYTPHLNFRGTDPLYLGVELELSTPYADTATVARQAYRELGDVIYLKSDCSIQPQGFEMVHHPMNYDWAYENYPRDALRRLRAAGAHPHTSCGMHIHVSRDGFASPAHTFKWMKWFYRHEQAVTTLARRRSSNYAQFDNRAQKFYGKHIAKGAFGAERYSAINASNEKTLEVRVFASTLNVRKLLAAMGLVDASVRYNAQITANDILRGDAWNLKGFKDYVHSFSKYAPLQQEMKRLGV